MTRIRPEETLLVGQWIFEGGKTSEDDVCHRIKELVGSCLKKVATDTSGWDALYQDPADGRYWERIFPKSEMQGGGPPSLRNISVEEARKKYPLE
jgi:hypothetical protein